MIIDFHTHVFPEEVRGNREVFFSSEPDFKLLYQAPNAKLANDKDLLKMMDEDRVDCSVLMGFPWKSIRMCRAHNDYILSLVSEYPERFIGFCCVDPFHRQSLEEIKRCRENGIRGVGEFGFYRTGITEEVLDRLQPIMDYCEVYRLPVVIHTNEPIGHAYPGKMPVSIRDIYRLVERFQDVTLILAHWGGGAFFFNLLKKEVKGVFRNVYVDTAASPFLYDPKVYEVAVRILGSRKILFGSDFPLLRPARYFRELDTVFLAPDDRKNILGRNAAELIQ